MKHALIAPGQPGEEAFHRMLEAARRAVGLEHLAAQHGREGQGHHAGDQHRPGEREGELGEQGADQAAHEADGCIDRHQGGGHGDDRHGQLPGALDGGLKGGLAHLDVAVHVLHHHDGIVHHQADGQNHGQQGEQVNGKAQHQHQEAPPISDSGTATAGIRAARMEPRDR